MQLFFFFEIFLDTGLLHEDMRSIWVPLIWITVFESLRKLDYLTWADLGANSSDGPLSFFSSLPPENLQIHSTYPSHSLTHIQPCLIDNARHSPDDHASGTLYRCIFSDLRTMQGIIQVWLECKMTPLCEQSQARVFAFPSAPQCPHLHLHQRHCNRPQPTATSSYN